MYAAGMPTDPQSLCRNSRRGAPQRQLKCVGDDAPPERVLGPAAHHPQLHRAHAVTLHQLQTCTFHSRAWAKRCAASMCHPPCLHLIKVKKGASLQVHCCMHALICSRHGHTLPHADCPPPHTLHDHISAGMLLDEARMPMSPACFTRALPVWAPLRSEGWQHPVPRVEAAPGAASGSKSLTTWSTAEQ